MIGRDDQSRVRILDKGARDRAESILTGGVFMDATVVAELLDGGLDVAAREGFDRSLERGILLSHDDIQPHGLDPRFLQLVKWSAGFDSVMLTGVSD